MRRVLVLSLVASTFLFAGERVKLFGTLADANGSVAHASGDPILTYQDEIMSADDIFYDQNASIVEAKGSVNIFKAGHYHLVSDYTSYNIQSETRYSKPYYMIDQSAGTWMSTDEAQGCQNIIDLASGALSGCDSTDPLWKIRFSSADYDTNAMWVNLYNPRLVIDNVPVFYLPYFGYPTDTTRRSGLLIPSLGLSNTEGFFYQQPIYLAPSNWWDAEFRPQIRTSRGSGIYSDFRFIDTPSSIGAVRVGYFKEQSDYATKYNLAHMKHYGYDVKYRHAAPLKEWFGLGTGESGLYVDGHWMNDVDYLNLEQSDEIKYVTTNQVISRINGYYSSEDNYIGTYFKHYQYLDPLINNAQTIQTLPAIQYHRYLESLWGDHLLINADAMASNFYRPDGKRAVEGDFSVPLTLQTSLFDNYLDLSYTANASSKVIGFYGNPKSTDTDRYENGIYAQLDHTFSLGSTLVHSYESNTTHVINPNVSYTSAGNRYYNGYYKTYHANGECIVGNTNPACEYYTLNAPSDTLSLGVNNYLFKRGKQFLVDRLSQNFRYDDQGSYYGELQNELEWQITSAISIYNQSAYNHDRNRVTKEQNTVRYNNGTVAAGISHYYTDTLSNNAPVYASYWTADLSYQYNRHYRIFADVAYDYRAAILKRSEIGYMYSQRCLDFGLRLVQNRRPILTNGNASNSVDDSYLFITIILKPIGGSEFNYKLTSNSSN